MDRIIRGATMKYIFIACLLLVAGPVSAEVTGIKLDSHHCAIDPKYPGAVLAYCQWDDRSGFIEVYIQPDPCLARMEEALKALHPFSMLNLEPVQQQIGLDLVKKKAEWEYRAELPLEDVSGYYPEGLTQTLNAKAGRAIVLWETVKRECMRMP